MKKYLLLLVLFATVPAWAGIPATPVMTLYQFNGRLEIPYYEVEAFRRSGPSSPAGFLTQGTSLIPCLVIRDGRPLTDRNGTPYVGFQIVVNSRTATPASTGRFKTAWRQRQSTTVTNHHCGAGVRHVISIRELYALEKAPFFDPPRPTGTHAALRASGGELDRIVRAFHQSPQCETANRRLIGRRAALQNAWDSFIRTHRNRWSEQSLRRAKHLDYTMRTAIFEGHLDRAATPTALASATSSLCRSATGGGKTVPAIRAAGFRAIFRAWPARFPNTISGMNT